MRVCVCIWITNKFTTYHCNTAGLRSKRKRNNIFISIMTKKIIDTFLDEKRKEKSNQTDARP